jgi:hypothetical protein
MSRRRDPNRRNIRQHAFVMGLLITESGMRLPLPRRSYYTKDYCARYGRRYRSQVQLAAAMLQELCLPDDVELTVVVDSAFDANVIHRVCRDSHFRAIFPLDPNRTLSAGPAVDAAGLAGAKVVHWTRSWSRPEFTLLTLQYTNEDHVFLCRRHGDNLRRSKTTRHYAVAARPATVTNLGTCVVVASYKENPSVQLVPGQYADWWAYHRGPIVYRSKRCRPAPQRWHSKVLACTDPTATAQQVVEWYEVRWQIEKLFQRVTEVFDLRHLIGGSPQATVFQAAFCFLLSNVIQTVRGYIAAAQQRSPEPISTQLLFDDVTEELTSWHRFVSVAQTQEWVQDGVQTAAQLRAYLRRRLAGVWDDRWQKAPTKRRAPKGKTQYLKGGHRSVYRILHGLYEVRSDPDKSKP